MAFLHRARQHVVKTAFMPLKRQVFSITPKRLAPVTCSMLFTTGGRTNLLGCGKFALYPVVNTTANAEIIKNYLFTIQNFLKLHS